MRTIIAIGVMLAAAQALAETPQEFYERCEAERVSRLARLETMLPRLQKLHSQVQQAKIKPGAKLIPGGELAFPTQQEKEKGLAGLEKQISFCQENLAIYRDDTQLAVPVFGVTDDLKVIGKQGYLLDATMECRQKEGPEKALLEFSGSLFLIHHKSLAGIKFGEIYQVPEDVCWKVSGMQEVTTPVGDKLTVPLIEEYDLTPIKEIWEQNKKTKQKAQPDPQAAEKPGEALAPLRTWTSADGKFNVTASLVKQTGNSITLRKVNGKDVTLSIDKLSEEDRKFLAK